MVTLPLPHIARQLVTSGGYGYVLGPCADAGRCADQVVLSIIDLLDATQPLLTGSVPLPSDVVGLAAVGNYVYGSGREMHIVDASDPGRPREVRTTGLGFSFGAGRLAAYGQRAYSTVTLLARLRG